jgi:uncharacterized protein (TIGR03437 family)
VKPLALLPLLLASAAAAVHDSSRHLPFHFEENRGQLPGVDAPFFARTGTGILLLRPTSLDLSSPAADLRFTWSGGNPRPGIEGEQPLQGQVSYFTAGSSIAGIRTFRAVRYRAVYPGIDLLVYFRGNELEYDWEIAPGARPERIRFHYPRARAAIDPRGDLVIRRNGATLRHTAPRLHQAGRPVPGRFVRHGASFGFQVGAYNRSLPLVIDPYIVYTGSFGGPQRQGFVPGTVGAGGGRIFGMDVDPEGHLYLTGSVTDPKSLPARPGVLDRSLREGGEGERAFVAKMSKDGTDFVFAVYLGGGEGRAMALDDAGNIYVTGQASRGFPRRNGPNVPPGGIFVAKINPTGTELLYSLTFGGTSTWWDDFYLYASAGTAIAVGPDRSVYFAGVTASEPIPATPGAWQPAPRTPACGGDYVYCTDAFAGKLTPDGSGFAYLTYLSGSSVDYAAGLVLDERGRATVVGTTYSPDFPTTPGALQPVKKTHPWDSDSPSLRSDGFLLRLNETGSAADFSTFIGGSGVDRLRALARGPDGALFVGGEAADTTDFGSREPSTEPPDVKHRSGQTLIAKLTPDGDRLLYLFRGIPPQPFMQNTVNAIAVNSKGEVIAGGATYSPGVMRNELQESDPMPNTACSLSPPGPRVVCRAAYLFHLDAEGRNILLGTEFGIRGDSDSSVRALRFGPDGSLFVAGMGTLPPSSTKTIDPFGHAMFAKLRFDGDGPRFKAVNVVNAASFVSALPQAGGLFSIFGTGLTSASGIVPAPSTPLPTELAGTKVIGNGLEYPILAVAGGDGMQQINAQAAGRIGWAPSAYLVVVSNGRMGYALPYLLSRTVGRAPGTGMVGIFELSPSQAAIVHGSDFSLVTADAPAQAGETITIFGTGFGSAVGLVNGEFVAGVPAPLAPLLSYWPSRRVSFDGQTVLSVFSGPAPGLVGVDQINVVVPSGLPSGKVPLRILHAENAGSQTVTVYVK